MHTQIIVVKTGGVAIRFEGKMLDGKLCPTVGVDVPACAAWREVLEQERLKGDARKAVEWEAGEEKRGKQAKKEYQAAERSMWCEMILCAPFYLIGYCLKSCCGGGGGMSAGAEKSHNTQVAAANYQRNEQTWTNNYMNN